MVHFSNDGIVTVETEQQPYQGYDSNRNMQYSGPPNPRPEFQQTNPYQTPYNNRVVSMPQQTFDGNTFSSYTAPAEKPEFHKFTDLPTTYNNEYQGFDPSQNSMQQFQVIDLL